MNKRNLLWGVAAAALLAAPLAVAGGRSYGPSGVYVPAQAWAPAPYHSHRGPYRSTRVRVVDVDPVFQRVRYQVPVQHCRQGRCRVHYDTRFDRRVVGYRVAWKHQGQRGIVQMPYRPGPYITVSFGIHAPR